MRTSSPSDLLVQSLPRCLRLLLLLVLAFFLCVPLSQAVHLRVGTVSWAGFSSLNVADAKAFWAAQGLDVEVIVYRSNRAVNEDLVRGRVDIALDMIGSWLGYYQAGVDIVILGESDWSHGGDKILAKKDFDPGNLAGQTVGIYLDQPSVTFFLDRFLRSHHLSLKDVRTVEPDTQALADSFIAGQLTLIVDYDPQATRAIREGDGRVFATTASYAGVMPEGFAVLRERWKRMPEEHLTKFWKGLLKAVTWMQVPENWKEYQQILNARTYPFDADFSETDLRAMVDAVSIHSSVKLFERNSRGGGLERYMDEMQAFFKRNDRLRRPMNPSELLQTELFLRVIQSYKP